MKNIGDFMATRIPSKLNNPKLVSVSFELRFEANEIYSDLVALNLANALVLQGKGSLFQLPIMQLPPIARNSDPNLRYAPLFGVQMRNVVAQVGPRVLVVTVENYPGWAVFHPVIKEVLNCTASLRKKTERIGFRTINFFEDQDIENNLITTVQNGLELPKVSCNFSLVYKDGDCQARYSFSNDAKMSKNGLPEQKGSFVDVDSFFEGNPSNIDATVNQLHDLGKKVFFESLKQEFVDSMGPVYGNN